MSRLYRKPTGELVLRSVQTLERPDGTKYYLMLDENADQDVAEADEVAGWQELSDTEQEEFRARPNIKAFLDERERQRFSVIVCSRGQRREYCQTPGHERVESEALCDWPIHRIKHRATCTDRTGQIVMRFVPGLVSDVPLALCGCEVEKKTCDRRMCRSCRRPVKGQRNTDYCPAHHALAQAKSK
jgi:hypothetical protein